MSTCKHKKNTVISNKYVRGENYMDDIEGFDELEIGCEDNYINPSYGKAKEFTMRIFPDVDW